MYEVSPGLKKTAVLCLLFSEEGLLLIKRAKDPHKGEYIPVGGKVDPFEDPHTAVIREVMEETGLTLSLDQVKFAGVLTETSPVKFNWVNFVYSANIKVFTPPVIEEGELSFIPLKDIQNLPTPETDRFIYQFVASNRIFMLNARYDSDLKLISLTEEIKNDILDIRP